MTEEEAKKKWCPYRGEQMLYATLAIMGAISKNREALGIISKSADNEKDHCIGSKCMAWNKLNDKEGFCKLIDKPIMIDTGLPGDRHY